MIRKLPYKEWMEARNDLSAIAGQARMRELAYVEPLLELAQHNLVVELSPVTAGLELESVANHLPDEPQLREAISILSRKIIGFAFAESAATP